MCSSPSKIFWTDCLLDIIFSLLLADNKSYFKSFVPTFSEPARGQQCAFMALPTLFHNKSVLVHSWTKSSVIKISIMETSWRWHVNVLYALSNNLVPDADTLHFRHLPVVANSFYGSKLMARCCDGSTTLLKQLVLK